MDKSICTVKVGTSALTNDDGTLNTEVMGDICRQVSELSRRHNILFVSSGAVAQGKGALKKYSGKIMEKKAAAAVGNPVLMMEYASCFKYFGQKVAQVLCSRENFSNRDQFVQLKNTIKTLWKHDILPIINENDVISDFELRFSDNDDLATLISVGFPANKLLLGTDIDGLMNKKGDGSLIKEINQFDTEIYNQVTDKNSGLGLGGMTSKLNAAKQATVMGVDTVIFNITTPGNILLADQAQTGTHCPAQESTLSARNKWMASGALCGSRVMVDRGAAKALKKRSGLLYVGVTKIEGNFRKGEIFEIVEESDIENPLAVARARLSSKELLEATDRKNIQLANPNQITLMVADEEAQ